MENIKNEFKILKIESENEQTALERNENKLIKLLIVHEQGNINPFTTAIENIYYHHFHRKLTWPRLSTLPLAHNHPL